MASKSLDNYLVAQPSIPTGLRQVILAIANSCGAIACALRTQVVQKANVNNTFGDDVLTVDLITDKLIGDNLSTCKSVASYASEEHPVPTKARPGGSYFVAFDPLDGSSVIGTNFTVGSIFGVWEGQSIVGQTVGDLKAAVVALYGPRCTLYVATKDAGVVEFLLVKDPSEFALSVAKPLRIQPKAKVFAPGNLRAANHLPWYREILCEAVAQELTLRYTGGMVPDVVQILIKGNGIFMTPSSPVHKMKLRVCFECGPLSFMIHCAGGASTDGEADFLLKRIKSLDDRSAVAMGSSESVALYQRAIQKSKL